MANAVARAWSSFYDSLNFFRIHVLFFTFTPLICASIFYAANGKYPVSFIDALFNCISAITVTGLATVDLSQLTGFQQALLFIQMCIGNPVAVSWVIVYVRRRFFRKELSHIISEELKRERQGGIIAAMRERTMSITRSFSRDNNNPNGLHDEPTKDSEKLGGRPGFFRRLATRFHPTASPGKSPASTVSGAATPSSTDGSKRKNGLAQRLRTDMIRRIETEPQRVDPMGLVVVHGKGKEREPNEQEARYESGEDVHQVATGSSRTRCEGNESPSPPEHDMDGEHHFRNGPIMTPPQLGPGALSPHSEAMNPNLASPPVNAESPMQLPDNLSAEMHMDAEKDGSVVEDAEGHATGANGHPILRSSSQDRSFSEGDGLSSHRAGVSHSPVRFRPPPIRVNQGTVTDDRLSPGRARELDQTYTQTSVSFPPGELSPGFGHARQTSDATSAFHPSGTGELPRTQTIEFAPQPRGRSGTRRQSAGVNSQHERERMRFRNFSMGGASGIGSPGSDAGDTSIGGAGASSQGHTSTAGGYMRARAGSTGRQRMGSVSSPYFPRTATGRSYGTTRVGTSTQLPSNQSGYGGFPMPHELAGRAIKKYLPQTFTLPRTLTGASVAAESRPVPYISFNAIVGRNSQFHDLSQEEQEELGGVEYRALTALLWIIAGYHIGSQLLAFVIIAPYSSMRRWSDVFREPQQHRFIPPTWFAMFQVVSAYTNAGMSLIDQSMVPFQTAYPMIVVMFILILAGNTAFPICLRFVIWLMSKCVGRRMHETLSFLLDHPRRCFIYLFPSHQTWFLFIVLLSMIITDWVSFMVLDIGNEVVEAVPLGTRFAIGLLQASAVRAAGFATISLSALAPAVKVLYVTMMYIAVYPVALSVRVTNVYEERSLGIYVDDEKSEEEPDPTGRSFQAWGSYLAWHARRQLSFDMWWLAFALWLVCIIERAQIMNPDASWFDIFAIIFELTSAYGTVGLSLGLPTANYSFSGALKPLSKLVICVVMLRGRHRGLPHAIDRAVVLPRELMSDRTVNGSNASNLDLHGNRPNQNGNPDAYEGAHSTGRATHGVDLKHRTNTLLSPVHEILTPVTSVTGTPRQTFAALGKANEH
ncbi:potassium/sodium transporter [Ceratobasidium sp. AG-Ba]|nr:potassium/sodium transporter [Ceratobasidium sp. AG-Ba]